MSIWCSAPSVGYDEMNDDDEDNPRGGHVLTYAHGWSNHHPDLTSEAELPACVGLASIAPFCAEGHDQSGPFGQCSSCGGDHDYPEAGTWLRLWVSARSGRSFWAKNADGSPLREPVEAAVVMDEAAARQLAADLLAWADRPKVTPAQPTAPTEGTTERDA